MNTTVKLQGDVTKELRTLPAAICEQSLKGGGEEVRRGGQEKEKIKTIHPILEITHKLQWIFLGFAIATVWGGKLKRGQK